MTITYPIGYPTRDPMHNPKWYPNRGRIARPVSYRPVSSPSYSVAASRRIVTYLPRGNHDGSAVTT